jgi:hypothetical protein
MIELKRALAAAGLLAGIVMGAQAKADPPAGQPKGEGAPGRDHKPADKADKGEKAEKGDKAEKADKGDKPGTAVPGAAVPGAATPGAPDALGKPGMRPHSELRELRDELKQGKLKKPDLDARLSKLRETNKERRDNHRASLKARWGDKLARPDTQNELALHEKRMAKLNRLLLLAQTERTGKDVDKLSERIEKLIDLETARHEKRMADLTSAPAVVAPAQSAAVNTEGAK